MTTIVTAAASGDTLAALDTAWRVGTTLTPVGYYPRFGPLPAVTEVRDQTGPWDAPGQTRQLMLSDGGWVVEHVVTVEPPARAAGTDGGSQDPTGVFAYDLTDFQRLFGRLVSRGHARWEYRPTNTGAHVRWTYSFTARPGAGPVLTAIVRLAWAPYMRRVLPGILRHLDDIA